MGGDSIREPEALLKDYLPDWMGRAPTEREWEWIGWTSLMAFFALVGWLVWKII